MDTRLLELLVCPVCKGPLQHDRHAKLLVCPGERLAYPVRDGMPFLLESEAKPLPSSAVSTADAGAGADRQA